MTVLCPHTRYPLCPKRAYLVPQARTQTTHTSRVVTIYMAPTTVITRTARPQTAHTCTSRSAHSNGAYMYLTQRAHKWRIHVPHAARIQMAHTCTSRSAPTNGAYMYLTQRAFKWRIHARPPSRGRQGRQGREKSLHRRRPKLVQFLQRSLQIAGGRGRHLIRRHRHTDVLHGQLHGDVG